MLGASLQQNAVTETTTEDVKQAVEEVQDQAKQANENDGKLKTDEEGIVGSSMQLPVESPAENVIIFEINVIQCFFVSFFRNVRFDF